MAPRMEFGHELCDLIRLGGCEVGGLSNILVKMIQFCATILQKFDQFPVAAANGAGGGAVMVVRQVPEQITR